MQDEALIARTQKFINATNSCLEGSPYQFPVDEKSLQVYAHIEESILNIQNKLQKLVLISDLPQPLKNSTRWMELDMVIFFMVFMSTALPGCEPRNTLYGSCNRGATFLKSKILGRGEIRTVKWLRTLRKPINHCRM